MRPWLLLPISALTALAAGMFAAAGSARPAAMFGPQPQPDELAADLDRRLAADVAPLLGEFCLKCHSGKEAKEGVRLDALTEGRPSVRAILTGDLDLRRVREVLAAGSMPPKSKPQPSEHQRLTLSQWVDGLLAYVPPDAAIDPGWFTPHRLNRAEYRNTLRDLLDLDLSTFDPASRLPPDDTGYGFDNIADVLSTSPLAVEQYLDAADRAIEAALGPVVSVGDKPRSLSPIRGDHGQPTPRGGFLLYSNGAAAAEFHAPAAGDYTIRVRAWETHAGSENATLSLRIGKKSIKDFSVSGGKDRPQELSVRTRLARGPHTIAAFFTNDYYVEGKADRNLAVESISVAGPLDEASIERPEAWRRLFGASAKGDAERARGILGLFASRAYRRPASAGEIASLMKVYQGQRKAGAEFEPAVRTSLAASLVSPNFLFRTAAHPAASDPAARYTLSGHELASRLSYFLWSSMPDEALLAAAADGSLLRDEVLAAQVRRMIASPKADAFIDAFTGQWLQLRVLDRIAIDREKFPVYTDALRADMAAEARLFFGDVLRGDRGVLEFIDSKETFLNARLAEHYGAPRVEGDQLRRTRLPEGSPRGGVLTMGAVLTLTSNTTRTSPVKRGLFVLDQILGAPPPPPPADVPPLEQSVHADPDATVRERLAAHVADPTCASCHVRLDPLGLAFEHFDAVGRWRDRENGRPIDADGTLPGGTVLHGAADLKKVLLGRSDQFIEALSAKLLTYALGRGVEPFDRPAVRRIAQRTRADGDRLSALVESIVLSETFRTCRGRKVDP